MIHVHFIYMVCPSFHKTSKYNRVAGMKYNIFCHSSIFQLIVRILILFFTPQ